MTKQKLHQSVLLESVLAYLKPTKGDSYLDLTAGMGGHAEAILSITENNKDAVLVDRDAFAIEQLTKYVQNGVTLLNQDFLSAAKDLVLQKQQFDLILCDLGVSSPQLDQVERGFSFSKSAKLDMRMDSSQELSADKIVNQYSASQLSQIFIDYGEVKPKLARKVATAIVQNRPITTTTDLANLICHLVFKRSKTHPATVYFQAIRIAVNDELGQLQKTLEMIPALLKPGGRVAIISFHSLEDRIVKQYFQQQMKLGLIGQLKIITKKPILGEIYDVSNPRSRSAKLRVALKQKQKGGYNAKTNTSLKQVTN